MYKDCNGRCHGPPFHPHSGVVINHSMFNVCILSSFGKVNLENTVLYSVDSVKKYKAVITAYTRFSKVVKNGEAIDTPKSSSSLLPTYVK